MHSTAQIKHPLPEMSPVEISSAQSLVDWDALMAARTEHDQRPKVAAQRFANLYFSGAIGDAQARDSVPAMTGSKRRKAKAEGKNRLDTVGEHKGEETPKPKLSFFDDEDNK